MSLDEYELLESLRREIELCQKKRHVRCCSACLRFNFCDVCNNHKELKNELKRH